MIKISKFTDYAIVILSELCNSSELLQATKIAEKTGLGKPTVARILKSLQKANILSSIRGVNGGYKMRVLPSKLKLTQIIEVMDGPIALVECALSTNNCKHASSCKQVEPWKKISAIVHQTLDNYNLEYFIENKVELYS